MLLSVILLAAQFQVHGNIFYSNFNHETALSTTLSSRQNSETSEGTVHSFVHDLDWFFIHTCNISMGCMHFDG